MSVLRRILDGLSHNARRQSIRPFLRQQIHLTVQFAHRNGFRIEHMQVYVLKAFVSVSMLFAQYCHGIRQHIVDLSFTAASGPNQHDTEPHIKRVKQLNNLGDKRRFRLQLSLATTLDNNLLQLTIIIVDNIDGRKQVRHDRIEQWQIIGQKLWYIAVAHRSNEHHRFINIGLSAFQTTRHHQHRLDCAHTKIVMILLRQLLRRQLVQFHHFLTERSSLRKTFSKEHDFSDKPIVGYHHCHRSKQHFEVVG
mmetsp:Transcript_45843/g.76266  ORF Transcript_45843/g.76266 Transcript_45843/m.76266 type:complete len:251 (-) Transcript_45843:138-890(-)